MNKDRQLARYIFRWLERRNRQQLKSAIEAMTVEDYRLAIGELQVILEHSGHPPNWSPEPAWDETL